MTTQQLLDKMACIDRSLDEIEAKLNLVEAKLYALETNTKFLATNLKKMKKFLTTNSESVIL